MATSAAAATTAGTRNGRDMGSKGRPYRTFLAEGFEILVGRGEKDNDALTFDVAEPHDLWLHVAGGTPGSHVVVRNPDQVVVPPAVVETAAAAAAWYSKARGAPRVEVHVCRVSDVRKPRGAPPGLVELARWKRVRVAPSLPRVEEDDGEGEEA
ncbi:MAG TPA: NFACT RNA binding domain-containing protein [Kofleriaceae bacterium]|nr:NFACT RNA binding domain-containing protein [Kofleriaceae bacterium]